MTTTVAPAKKVRKPRVKKLPTVIDNEPVVYGCEIPENYSVKLVEDKKPSRYVQHEAIPVMVCANTDADLRGMDLWVDREGNAYNAYPRRKFSHDSEEYKMYLPCSGHSMWAMYYMRMSVTELENKGWLHISGGRVACFKNKITKKQQDFLELWSLFNGRCLDTKIDNLGNWRKDTDCDD